MPDSGIAETPTMIGSWPPVHALPRQASGVAFVGQADYIAALRDRVKAIHESKDFLPLDEQSRVLHGRALASFSKIEEEHPQMLPLLTQYCETVEAADLRSVADALAEVKGTEQIVHVARGNFLKQTDRLLVGASDVIREGKAVVTNFGTGKSFDSIEQIQQALNEIYQDFREVRYLFEDHVAGRYQGNVTSDMFSRLEKYMFDGKNLEIAQTKTANTLIIQDESKPELDRTLKNMGITPSDESRDRGLFHNMSLAGISPSDSKNFFFSLDAIPHVIILHIPYRALLNTDFNFYRYEKLYADLQELPHEIRPRVIAYTEGFTPPLYVKHDYQGFLFCSTPDELRNVISLSRNLAHDEARDLYNPKNLEPGQREAYDNSDLREWEGRTADTYTSLLHIFQRFNHRNDLFRTYRKDRYSRILDDDGKTTKFHLGSEPKETPLREVRTVLDLGTGEGRIAGMLARAGYNVMGLDISRAQLARSRERMKEEGEGLRGEKEELGLSYHALMRLHEEGVVDAPISSDKDATMKLLTVQGSFFELQDVLNQALVEWDNLYPDVDRDVFFDRNPWGEPFAFRNPKNMFLDSGFDEAMFNWHTYCEVGSPENQKRVLEQILNVLLPGGELIIEIPDRNIEPYASALRAYNAAHPDEPYGTIRDPKPEGFQGLEGQDLYPPRYFPDINELTLLLKSVGFEIDPKTDIQSYMIEHADPKTGEKSLALKEHFIMARKSTR